MVGRLLVANGTAWTTSSCMPAHHGTGLQTKSSYVHCTKTPHRKYLAIAAPKVNGQQLRARLHVFTVPRSADPSLATGAHERPLGSYAKKRCAGKPPGRRRITLIRRYGVVPGKRLVCLDATTTAYRAALDWAEAAMRCRYRWTPGTCDGHGSEMARCAD